MRFFFLFLHALLPLYQNSESQSGITIHKVSHIHSHSSFLSLFNEVSSSVYTTGALIHILFLLQLTILKKKQTNKQMPLNLNIKLSQSQTVMRLT